MALRAYSDLQLQRELSAAVTDQDAASMRYLASQGADVNARDAVGMTLLQNAANEGAAASADVLIDLGADVNLMGGSSHWTALHYAAYRQNRFMTEILLRGHADPNIATPDGETPLHTAAHAGNLEVVIALVRGGADVRAKDSRGHTAADIAAIRAQETLQFAQEPFVEVAVYLGKEIKRAEANDNKELAQQEEVSRNMRRLKSLHPERFRLRPR